MTTVPTLVTSMEEAMKENNPVNSSLTMDNPSIQRGTFNDNFEVLDEIISHEDVTRERAPFLPHVSRVAVVGDLHGNTKYTRKVINYALGDDDGADVILQVGDFGAWDEKFPNAVQTFMEQFPDKHFLFLDGNHEHHRWLNSQPVDNDGVRRLTRQVWHLPRGFRWKWGDNTCVAVGGALSVDANWREAGYDWFPEERLSPQEYMQVVSPGRADVVFAHDAPGGYVIPGLPPAGTFPRNSIADAEHYRQVVMQGIGEALTPTRWWHGHYHVDYEECLFWESGIPCLVRGLNCDRNPFTQVVDFWTP